jgi:hypothetical protein
MCGSGAYRQDFSPAAKGAESGFYTAQNGRDGIHGATMASAEFNVSEEKRPTVQVGDPFTEKLLLEACLELMATDAIIAIQDMGAAGLTSSSAEMADKGGSGIELDLDHVPQRETNMTAYDMMLSESQERMLAVLKPGREAQAEAIFKKWELDFAVIGITTDTKRLVVKHSEVVADMPVTSPSDEAPPHERPSRGRRHLAACRFGIRFHATGFDLLLKPAWTCVRGAAWSNTTIPFGRHDPDAGRRCRRGARAWDQEGARNHHRCQPALLQGRSLRGRETGGRGSLAQPDRGGRNAACRHRQS